MNLSIISFLTSGICTQSTVYLGMMLCLLLPSYIHGQVDSTSHRPPDARFDATVVVADDAECIASDYYFKVDGVRYDHKNKVYQCGVSFPAMIEVYNKADDSPVSHPTTWENADVDQGDMSHATIKLTHFGSGDKKEVKCVIAELGGGSQEIKMKFIKNAKIKFSPGPGSTNFDANQRQGYPSYNTVPPGRPWKYIIPGEQESVKAKLSTGKVINSVSWRTNDLDMDITPTIPMSSNFDAHLFYNESIDSLDLAISGCNEETELNVFVANKKSLTVDFVYVCNERNGQCPSEINIADEIHFLNSIYNSSGVEFTHLKTFHDTIKYSSKNTFRRIQLNTIDFIYQRQGLSSADILVMIVNDLGRIKENKILGRATAFYENSLALDRSNFESETLSHEIGHAAFGFFHPHDPLESKSLVTPVAKKFPPVDDTDNYMYWDSNGRTDTKIRAYQFKRMH